jgi:hypothetical protein
LVSRRGLGWEYNDRGGNCHRRGLARFKRRDISAFGDGNHHRLGLSLSGKVLFETFAKLADLDADNVVIARTIVRRSTEDPAADDLFFQIFRTLLHRLLTDIEQQLAQAR